MPPAGQDRPAAGQAPGEGRQPWISIHTTTSSIDATRARASTFLSASGAGRAARSTGKSSTAQPRGLDTYCSLNELRLRRAGDLNSELEKIPVTEIDDGHWRARATAGFLAAADAAAADPDFPAAVAAAAEQIARLDAADAAWGAAGPPGDPPRDGDPAHAWTFDRSENNVIIGWRCSRCGAVEPTGPRADLPAAGCTAAADSAAAGGESAADSAAAEGETAAAPPDGDGDGDPTLPVWMPAGMPAHWVMADAGGARWLVPAVVDGWSRRRGWSNLRGDAGLERVPRSGAIQARMTTGACEWDAGRAALRAAMRERGDG